MSEISKSILQLGEEEERQYTISALLPQVSVIKPKYQVIYFEILFYQGTKFFLSWDEDFNNQLSLKEISRTLLIKLQEELGKEMKKFVVPSIQGNIKQEKKKLILVETLNKYEFEFPLYNLIDGKQCQMIVAFEMSDQKYESQSQIIDSKGNSNILSEIISGEKQ